MCIRYRYFFFQAEEGIRDLVRSRGLGDVYERQVVVVVVVVVVMVVVVVVVMVVVMVVIFVLYIFHSVDDLSLVFHSHLLALHLHQSTPR